MYQYLKLIVGPCFRVLYISLLSPLVRLFRCHGQFSLFIVPFRPSPWVGVCVCEGGVLFLFSNSLMASISLSLIYHVLVDKLERIYI